MSAFHRAANLTSMEFPRPCRAWRSPCSSRAPPNRTMFRCEQLASMLTSFIASSLLDMSTFFNTCIFPLPDSTNQVVEHSPLPNNCLVLYFVWLINFLNIGSAFASCPAAASICCLSVCLSTYMSDILWPLLATARLPGWR